MPLYRLPPTGRLLRTSGGLLTHDPDCCCVEDCGEANAACGPPTLLTATLSGVVPYPWQSSECCIEFNGEYDTVWSLESECHWSANERFWMMWEDSEGCFVDSERTYDWSAIELSGDVFWNNIAREYRWSAQLAIRFIQPTAGTPGPPFALPWEASVESQLWWTSITPIVVLTEDCLSGDSYNDSDPLPLVPFACQGTGETLFEIEF